MWMIQGLSPIRIGTVEERKRITYGITDFGLGNNPREVDSHLMCARKTNGGRFRGVFIFALNSTRDDKIKDWA